MLGLPMLVAILILVLFVFGPVGLGPRGPRDPF